MMYWKSSNQCTGAGLKSAGYNEADAALLMERYGIDRDACVSRIFGRQSDRCYSRSSVKSGAGDAFFSGKMSPVLLMDFIQENGKK